MIRKVILVEDESPALQLLKEYLQLFPQLEIIAECRNGNDAVKKIDELKPDLIFLDIQMSGKTGFEILREVKKIPNVIFTTAYDQFAIQAFEVNAVDYLLKPYTKERFKIAVNKLLSKTQDMEKIMDAISETAPQHFPKHILVEDGSKLTRINMNEIIWIEANGDYTSIHLPGQSYLSNKSMNELEKKLDPALFQRVHRSAIIALSAITEAYKEPSGLRIVLTNGIQVKVSRSYTEVFRNYIY